MLKDNNPVCSVCEKERPAFTDAGDNIPKRCEDCRQEGDWNVAMRECDTCKEMRFVNEDLFDCDDCHYWNTARPYKERELMVKAILDEAGVEYTTYNDRPEGSCNNYRPDFTFDCGAHTVVLEVDENQHMGYPEECERIRMFNIFQDLGMRTVFIRFNPDAYTDAHGDKRAWTQGRGTALVDILRRTFDHVPEHPCSVAYMYYDGYERLEFEPFTYESVKIENVEGQ
jgi:hypothetical protein